MSSHEKPKRIRDQKLMNFIKTLPCMACGKTPSDPDHITTKGAGGDDVASNLWPLCREHHSERHNKGLQHMADTYVGCLMWLRRAKRTDVLNQTTEAK